MLKFQDQTYRQQRALFQISELQLNSNELVILFGANGTGKSTWLKSIVHPLNTENEYFLGNISSKHYSQEDLAKKIAFVDNHFLGLDHLRVSEYVALGRFPFTGISGRLGVEDKTIISTVCEKLKINHLLDKSTSTLSDGERQRCNIAKALVQETSIILLDEPTSFLDYPSKIELFQLLRDIVKQENKLVIVSTHDLEMGLEFGTSYCIITRNNEFIYKAKNLTKEELLQVSFDSI